MNWRLKEAILRSYGTQVDFARAVGISDSVVSRVVRGRKELSEEERKKWTKLLNEKGSMFSGQN